MISTFFRTARYLAVFLLVLTASASHAQLLGLFGRRQPAAVLPDSLLEPAVSLAPKLPPGSHLGGYTPTGQHYTIERLAPPEAPAPYGAQGSLLDVAVSDSSTTYLVFAGGVSLVDVGMMDNYLVKIEGNAVFVRARSKKAPPTPVLVRYGTKSV